MSQPNRVLPWCWGCPDHEACSQGACYLLGGPVRPGDNGERERREELRLRRAVAVALLLPALTFFVYDLVIVGVLTIIIAIYLWRST